MIQQVLKKSFLRDVAEALRVEALAPVDDRRSSEETPMDGFSPTETHELLQALDVVQTELAPPSLPNEESRRDGEAQVEDAGSQEPFMARSAELSNLQSSIEQYFLEERIGTVTSADAEDRRDGSTPMAAEERLTIFPEDFSDRRLFGRFEQTDIRWIGSLLAKGLRKFRGSHPFVARPIRKEPIPLPEENLRIIVVGDWGSGIPRAQKVADFMRRELHDPAVAGWQRHVVHLGDVYYSGWKREYRDRLLKYWPVRPEEKDTIGSFNLNGNHDMYSGGWDFYDFALADERFAAWQGGSSLFTLANSKWQLFGLDTSHADADFAGDQPAWIRSATLPDRKLIFLSHHQYASSYEKPAEKLITAIDPVLKSSNMAAWLWGHEHRCMTFESVAGIRYPACIGHGGVPVYQTHDAGTLMPKPGKWEYRDYIDGGLELWAKFGFVTLDFYGDKIAVRYINEDGEVHRTDDVIA